MNWQLRFRSLLGQSLVIMGCTAGLSSVMVSTAIAQDSVATSKPADRQAVAAALTRLKELASNAKVTTADGKLTEIVIQDGASITAEDVALFGKLTDLT